MNKTFNKTISVVGGLTLFCLAVASAQAANTVSFTQPAFNVSNGDSLTVDLVGTDFTVGPDGAAFSLAWNPAVLSYIGIAFASPPWDATSVSDTNAFSGLIDFVFLSKTTGDAGTNFALASFTFDVVGNAGALSSLILSNDPYNVGFISPGAASIDVNYVNSQVQVAPVPDPPTAWLFGTGLLGLLGSMRIRKPVRRIHRQEFVGLTVP